MNQAYSTAPPAPCLVSVAPTRRDNARLSSEVAVIANNFSAGTSGPNSLPELQQALRLWVLERVVGNPSHETARRLTAACAPEVKRLRLLAWAARDHLGIPVGAEPTPGDAWRLVQAFAPGIQVSPNRSPSGFAYCARVRSDRIVIRLPESQTEEEEARNLLGILGVALTLNASDPPGCPSPHADRGRFAWAGFADNEPAERELGELLDKLGELLAGHFVNSWLTGPPSPSIAEAQVLRAT